MDAVEKKVTCLCRDSNHGRPALHCTNWATSAVDPAHTKQEKILISTCGRKHLICELWLKECMMALRHIVAELCEMFSISWPMDRYRRTYCMASTLTGLESSGFLPVGTPKKPCVCSSCWHFTIALWMPVRQSATAPPSFDGRGGTWWDVEAWIESHVHLL
jgi:hypothetical protein